MASDKLDDLRTAVNASKITSKRVEENLSTVFLKGKKYLVYVYDPVKPKRAVPETGEYREGTLGLLYTCINCEFAIWTLEKLFQFLEPFPVKTNASFSKVQNNAFRINYKESIKNIVDSVTEHVDRFVDILLNFLNAHVFSSYYDTGLLKSLLELNFKIRYIKSLGEIDFNNKIDDESGNTVFGDESNCFDWDDFDDDNEENDRNRIKRDKKNDCLNNREKTEGFDDVVVRVVLKTINSIQIFMAVNCDIQSFFRGNNRFGSLFAFQSPTNEYERISVFLNDISSLHLESERCCGVKEMLFLETSFWKWAGMEWRTASGHDVSVEDVVKQIEVTHDLEIIHWYQEMVFKTTMKIVFGKALKFDEIFPDKVVNLFRVIFEKLLSDFNNLPADVIEIFTLLNEYNRNAHDDLMEKITRFHDSVYDIYLGLPEQNELSSIGLVSLLGLIVENAGNVRCFLRLFDYLSSEYSKNYVPFLTDPTKIDSFAETNVSASRPADEFGPPTNYKEDRMISAKRAAYLNNELLNDAGCKFFGSLNRYCFMALFTLNSALANRSEDGRGNYLHDVDVELKNAYFLLTGIVSSGHRAHFKTVCLSAPLLENFVLRKPKKRNYQNYLRLAIAVFFALNAHNLEHCRTPEFNLWFSYGLNLGLMGRFAGAEEEIAMASKTARLFERPTTTYSYFTVIGFDDYAGVFDAYETKILFDWKSEKRSVSYVYRHTKSTVFGPADVYAFYDVFVKFFLAFTFYELHDRKLFPEKINDRRRDEFRRMFEVLSQKNRFPVGYKRVLVAVDTFVRAAEDRTSGDENVSTDPRTEVREILYQFELIGVSFALISCTIYTEDCIQIGCFLKVLNRINGMFDSVLSVLDVLAYLNAQ